MLEEGEPRGPVPPRRADWKWKRRLGARAGLDHQQTAGSEHTRQMLGEPRQIPYSGHGGPVFDTGRLANVLQLCADRIGWGVDKTPTVATCAGATTCNGAAFAESCGPTSPLAAAVASAVAPTNEAPSDGVNGSLARIGA